MREGGREEACEDVCEHVSMNERVRECEWARTQDSA